MVRYLHFSHKIRKYDLWHSIHRAMKLFPGKRKEYCQKRDTLKCISFPGKEAYRCRVFIPLNFSHCVTGLFSLSHCTGAGARDVKERNLRSREYKRDTTFLILTSRIMQVIYRKAFASQTGWRCACGVNGKWKSLKRKIHINEEGL